MAEASKRLGILTFHKCINYGSYWQALCLAEGNRALGHEVELLDHDCKCVRRSEARCALHPKLPERTALAELKLYAEKGSPVRESDRPVALIPTIFRSTSPAPPANMKQSSLEATKCGISAIPATEASRSSSAMGCRRSGWSPMPQALGTMELDRASPA